jgi:hypothetical protein
MQKPKRIHALACACAVAFTFMVIAQERATSAGACYLCYNYEDQTEHGIIMHGQCLQHEMGFFACGVHTVVGVGSYCEQAMVGCMAGC